MFARSTSGPAPWRGAAALRPPLTRPAHRDQSEAAVRSLQPRVVLFSAPRAASVWSLKFGPALLDEPSLETVVWS